MRRVKREIFWPRQLPEKWFRVNKDGEHIAQMRSRCKDLATGWWWFSDGWVDPEYRGQGWFRVLWEERMAWTLAQGALIIEGYCNAANEKFFYDAGFEVVKTENGEKHMRLIIDPVALARQNQDPSNGESNDKRKKISP